MENETKTPAEFEFMDPVNQDAMDFLKDHPEFELTPDEPGDPDLPEIGESK